MRFEQSIWCMLGAGVLMASRPAASAELTCSSSATLEALVTCIRDQMPGRDSGIFVAPSSTQMTAWRSVVRAMMGGSCNLLLPSSLSSARIRLLRDAGNGRRYCVLMEVADRNSDGIVDLGLGTFIVDAAAERELSHSAPHATADLETEIQAISIFKATRSRSFLMAGAHRDASFDDSVCQSSYLASDVAHDVTNAFHATFQELAAFYGSRPWWAIEWHGMARDTCAEDVFASHGMDVAPARGDKIVELTRNLLARKPTWRVGVPGSSDCSLNATTNVQGRLLNGVPTSQVCGRAAASYSGRFLHIEQDPAFRDARDWIDAVMDTWR
ncbi:hypothetical protein [Sorangium sp. So ce1000]|uniref:hypothetical protein n=1 Tax=Sorangium sp. So ce1000 TaxID=3133325 RepID=UPI003F631491